MPPDARKTEKAAVILYIPPAGYTQHGKVREKAAGKRTNGQLSFFRTKRPTSVRRKPGVLLLVHSKHFDSGFSPYRLSSKAFCSMASDVVMTLLFI